MPQDIKSRCFVIMPISKSSDIHTEEYWNQHYTDFLKPHIEKHSVESHRSSPLRGDMLRQIIADLVTTPMVIADLTDSNPNVYWELGVRQSFKHGTITIAESGVILPFDIGVKGTLYYYPNNHIKMLEFIKNFDDAIDDCLNNPKSPDSHVLEHISGRGTLFQIIMKDESIRKLEAVLSEIQSNLSILTQIKGVHSQNDIIRKEKKEVGIQTVTDRLKIIALENLIVNRYIDAPKNFFTTTENLRNACIAINTQLDFCDLTDNPAIGEKWILSKLGMTRDTIKDFKKLVIKQQENIALSL